MIIEVKVANSIDVIEEEFPLRLSDRYRTTKICRKFIRDFDRGLKVKPFKFRLIREI